MKKLFASAGLVSLGTVGLQAAYAPGLSPMETAKPWSISATLRGFYDDNYNNAPSNPSDPTFPKAKSSGGVEISPSFKLNFPLEQTYLGAGLLYSMKYYFDRPKNDLDHLTELTLKAEHRLSERYKVSFDDSFVYTVEPEIVDSSGPLTSFQRQDSDAIRNRGKINFKAQVTDVLGAEASYQNSWFHYLQDETITSLPATLNRFEHLFDIKGRYQLQEHLTGLVGYQYGITDYTSHQFLADPSNVTNGVALTGNDRDNTSHYFYVGAEHAFSSQLNGSIDVGAQYTSYDHINSSTWNPYADIRGTYTYLPGSFLQFGFTQTRNATDQVGGGTSTTLTTDQESSTVFASINHRITPRVTGSVVGHYQRSTYNGGPDDGKVDSFVLLGLNLEYRINNNWLTEVGYNLDYLDSDLQDRGFTRNRIYAGVRANF